MPILTPGQWQSGAPAWSLADYQCHPNRHKALATKTGPCPSEYISLMAEAPSRLGAQCHQAAR